MNNKTTKKALFSSVLALILCVSMLVGTTFAWFTDSVTSGNNNIIAGNLDIELTHTNAKVTDEEDVSGKTDLFCDVNGNAILWEPGVVAWENLTVKNVGTLALKYQMAVNFLNENWVTVDDVDYKLSDILKVGVVSGGIQGTDRETVVGEVTAWQPMADFVKEGKLLPKDSTLTVEGASEESETYGIVIYWEPSANDNNWNLNNGKKTNDGAKYLHIDLGINLVATQLEAESDSFDNLYDDGAYLPIVYDAAELISALENGDSAKLGANITVEETLNVAAGVSVTLDLNGKTLSSGNALVEDVIPVIDNRGTLVLKNGTLKATDTTAIRNHGTNAKLTMDDMTVDQESAVDPEWQGTAVITSGGATTTINSGNYSGVSSAAIVATSGGHLVINGGTFEADVTTVRIDCWNYSSYLTINGGTFNVSADGAKALYADGYKNVTVNGGTFNGPIDSTYTAININGGTFTRSIKQPNEHQNYYVINCGTFVDDLSVSISKNTKVNGTVTDNGDGTYTVAITADDAKELISNGGNVTLAGTIDMKNETVVIPNGTTISGGVIENAVLSVADDYTASFSGVKFSDTTTVDANGDGALTFTDCEFNVSPAKYKGFSRGAAIIGANQYYTIDLKLEGCTFNYQYESGDADLYNAAIFLWSNVDSCEIKNCTFNGYGFVAVKLMNVAEGAEIVFEGNTFNMCKAGAANNWYNNAVQIMPQHDNAFTVKFINNTFTGDFENGNIVADLEVMHGGALSNLTFEQSGNTINGNAVTDANFEITEK